MAFKQYVPNVEPFEAIQWNEQNIEEVREFLKEFLDGYEYCDERFVNGYLVVDCDNSTHHCALGDYLVSNNLGVIAIQKKHFESTYKEWGI